MLDFLVIGQGLAGSFVTSELLARGLSVHCIDPCRTSASTVAVGLLNPVVGKRHSAHGKFVQHSPAAFAAYDAIPNAISYHPIERILIGEEERTLWHERKEKLIAREIVEPLSVSRRADIDPYIHGEWDGYTVVGGGRVDTAQVVQFFRNEFNEQGILQTDTVNPTRIRYTGAQWEYNGEYYRNVVWCEGYRAQFNPLWSWLPYLNAKGHVLRLRIPNVPLGALTICGGKYLARCGETDEFLYGADYDWHWSNDSVDETSVSALLVTLRSMLNTDIDFISAQAGIRTVVMDFGALLGAHPEVPSSYICNGLGAKGALLAPAYSTLLIDHILEGTPLPKEHTAARYWNKTITPHPAA